MARDKAQLQDVFWHGSFGFVSGDLSRQIESPKMFTTKCPALDKTLSDSGRLPDLKGAPLASWVLARLAFLSGRKFPYGLNQIIGSDGADFWLRYYSLNKELIACGLANLTGSHSGVDLWINHFREEDGVAMGESFVQALLSNPLALRECRIVVQYTEMTDPNFHQVLPQVYGWDGHRFLNDVVPQYAVYPDGDF